MSLKKIFLLLTVCLVSTALSARVIAPRNSLSIKPTADFDQRFYYTPNKQNVWGYRFGVMMHDKYKVGIGTYYMSDNSVVDYSLYHTAPAFNSPLNQRHYIGTVYYEPFLFRRKYWESSIVSEVGYGRIQNIFYTSNQAAIYSKQTGYFIPAGLGLSFNLKFPAIGNFKPTRWFGINLCAGGRTSLRQTTPLNYNYQGYYWSISGAVFLDRVAEDYVFWRKKRKARNIYKDPKNAPANVR